MNPSQATTTMTLLFALRCLAPLALMFGIGYVMNRLVDRWEGEAAEVDGNTAVVPTTTPCWSIIQCDPELRADCPGFKNQMTPCWLARTRTEGTLPDECIACPIYEEAPALA